MGIEFRNSPKLRILKPNQKGFTCAGCACKKICASDLKKIKKRKDDKNPTVINNTFNYIEKQFEYAQTSRGISVHQFNFINQKTSHHGKGKNSMHYLDRFRLSMPELAAFLNLTPHQREHWLKKSRRELSFQAEFDILLDNSLLTHESERQREFFQLRNEAVRGGRKYVEMPPVKAEKNDSCGSCGSCSCFCSS